MEAMWKVQTNKFNSYQGISSILMKKREKYSSNKLFIKFVDEYMTFMQKILEVAADADNKTNSLTKEKYKMKELMAGKAVALASAGLLYARDINDAVLYAELDITFSDIKFARDAEALLLALNIEQSLRRHLDKLGEYMITDRELDELRTSVNNYEEILKIRAQVKNVSVISKKNLNELYDRMDAFLYTKMDRIMRRIGKDDPDFAALYFQGRKIYNR